MSYSIFIPGRFPSLNDYINAERSNKFAGSKMKKEYTALAAKYFHSMPVVDEAIYIQFMWHELNAKRDPDNIIFAKKFILDGLVASGKLPNDNMKWISGFEESWDIDKLHVGVDINISW